MPEPIPLAQCVAELRATLLVPDDDSAPQRFPHPDDERTDAMRALGTGAPR